MMNLNNIDLTTATAAPVYYEWGKDPAEDKRIREALKAALTLEHKGKMEGMISLSTSPAVNEFCQARQGAECDCVCEHCYAQALQDFRKTLGQKLARNTELLTAAVYPVEFFPVVNVSVARLEAFGDLNNTNQAINYFHFCMRNAWATFAQWTKNPFIIAAALQYCYKPENLIIIYSDPMINGGIDPAQVRARWPFVDKVFTVWTDEATAAAAGRVINCGARHCFTCSQCYRLDGAEVINELLK